MVAFAQTLTSRAGTLFGLDSITSGNADKSTKSSISQEETGNTLGEKDNEDETTLTSYEGDVEDTTVSLDDVIRQQITFRENKLHALLLRPETANFLKAASTEDVEQSKREISALMFQSNEHLYTFADLVTEDLIKFVDGHVALTPLCQRMIDTLVEEWEDDQS